jgi:hypothetical protein
MARRSPSTDQRQHETVNQRSRLVANASGAPALRGHQDRLGRPSVARPLQASTDHLLPSRSARIVTCEDQGTAQAEAASHCPGCPLGTAQVRCDGTLVARPARKTMLTPGGDSFHVDVSVSPVAGGQLRRWQAAKAARQPWRRNPRSSQRVHERSPAGRHAATGWTPSTRPGNGSDLHGAAHR